MSFALSIATAICLNGTQADVSPNMVWFDCVGDGVTTGARSSLYSTTTDQFRKNWVFFDYDDTHATSGGSATWSTGADTTRLKTESKGAIGAHVYERDWGGGNRVANPVAYGTDGVNWDSATVAITTYDAFGPNSPYTNCHIVTTDGVTTGAPDAGTYPLFPGSFSSTNTNNWATVQGLRAANRLLLCKRGQTWTCASTTAGNLGNWSLGAWGSGAKPLVNATASGVCMIAMNTSSSYSNVRVSDINLQENGRTGLTALMRVDNNFGYNHVLIYGIDFDMSNNDFCLWMDSNHLETGVHIIGCTGIGREFTFFSGGTINSSMLGNSFTQVALGDVGGGNSRWGHVFKTVMSNNDWIGGCFFRQHIKIHAQAGTYSEWILFSCNKLTAMPGSTGTDGGGGGSGDTWWLDFAPTSGSQDERVRNVVVEDNICISDYGSGQIFFQFACSQLTARNNVGVWNAHDVGAVSLGNPCARLLSVARFGIEPIPNDFEFYGNVAYATETESNAGGSDGGVVLVFLSYTGATNVIARDNAGSAPGWARTQTIYDAGITGPLTQSNNQFSNTPAWVNASGTFRLLTDFKIGPTSAFAGTGFSAIPAGQLGDAGMTKRPASDKGAWALDQTSTWPWESGSPAAPSQSNAPRAMHHYRGMLQ